jgi:hypothetical protein
MWTTKKNSYESQNYFLIKKSYAMQIKLLKETLTLFYRIISTFYNKKNVKTRINK